MGRRFSALAGAVAVLLFVALPVRAATAIYYSAPENTFGWCAGYGPDRSERCARDYCVESGGTDCQLALECKDDWGAIVKAWEPTVGFGAACGLNDAFSARVAAIASCVAASNTLCWTEVTFDEGGDTASDDTDLAFEPTWYVQGMLQLADHEPGTADGNVGRQTADAIRQFQGDIGAPQTGAVDLELFYRLLDAVGGQQDLAQTIERDVFTPRHDRIADIVFANAPSPLPKTSFSEELMARSEEDRLMALATILSVEDVQCTLPATSATLMGDGATAIWNVTCAEGTYVLTLMKGATMITGG
jgi:peptidoglycan hydrolase-like protein with peptidoglycan-binding domain